MRCYHFNCHSCDDPNARVAQAVKNWVQKYQPSCAESIYQVDRIQEGLHELAEQVCDIVGYYKEE